MNIKINIIRLLFVALGFIFSISNINATHIVGGDITYKYLGKDTFEVTLTIRRDCNLGSPEAQFDDPALLSIYDGRTGRVRIDLGKNGQVNVPYRDDDTLNTFIRSDCGFEGAQVCVHETKYVTKIYLPYNTRGYYIVYQRCCRNSSLNNIVDPLEAGSTYSVRIDRVPQTQTNSSPVFKNWPDIYICKDKPIDFDNSARDADGDSLVYKLWNPILGLTREAPQLSQPFAVVPDFVPVQFLPSYGLNNLLGGTPLRIDSITGKITGTPNMVGQFLVGVEVQEYRNGVYLGSVYRDFQYNVRVCALPPVANFTAPDTDCNGLTLTFDNTSTTATRFEWNFNYPSTDAAFKSTEVTPTFTFPSAGIYDVQLVAIRGSDQCRTEVIKKVSVFDLDYDANFDFKTTVCSDGDSLTLQLIDQSTISDPQFSTQRYRWTLTQGSTTLIFEGPSPIVRVSATQDLVVTLEVQADNLCTSSITKNIKIGDIVLTPDFEISDFSCADGETITLTLTDKSTYRGSNDSISGQNWVVTTDDGNTFTSSAKTITFTTNRVGFNATLRVTGNGCADTITKSFQTADFFPTVTLVTTLVECQDTNTLLKFIPVINGMSSLVTVTDFIWTANGDTINADSITYLVMGNNNVVITLDVILSNGCSLTFFRSFNGNAFRPRGAISVSQVECTTDDLVTLSARYTGTSGQSGLSWTYGLASALQTSTAQEITFTIPKDSAYSVSVLATYAKSCEAFVSQQFTGKLFADIDFITNPLELCVGEQRKIVLNPNSAFTYTWSPSDGLDLTVPSDPVLTATTDQVYSVTVSDGVCSVTKQLTVDVIDSLLLAIVGNTNTCDGSVSLTAEGNKGVGTYQWSFNPDFSNILSNTDNLNFQMTQDTQIVYLNFLSDVCNVKPTSVTVINRTPTVVKSDQNIFCARDRFTYQLQNANPNEPFTVVWSQDPHIVSDLSSSSINIVTSGEDVLPIKLYYKLLNAFGCETNDSIIFAPSLRPNIDWTFNNKECGKTEICFNISGDIVGGLKWDFGVPNIVTDTSSAISPCYTFPDFGTYTVSLTSTQSVCGFAPVVKQMNVNIGVDLVAESEVVLCSNDTATISVKSNLPELTITWTDAQGNVVSNGPTYTFVPVADQILILSATDAGGCTYSDTVSVKINRNFPELSAEGPFTVCFGDTAILKAFSTDVSQYNITWDASQYIIGTLNVANPQLGIGNLNVDSFNLTFRVINSEGCSITGNAPVIVQTAPTADFTFTRADCNTKEVCFNSALAEGYDLKWDFGVGNISSDTSKAIAPCYTFADFGTYTVTLTSLQDFCYFEPVTKQINVNEGLDLVGQSDVLLCTNDTAIISVKSGLPDLLITWTDAQGNVVANGPVYSFVPVQDQILILTASDPSGCTYRDTVNVKIDRNFPELTAEGPFTVCLGDTGILKAFTVDVSQFDITWDQNQYIIGELNIANPQLGIGGTSTDSIDLTFKVINSQGCSITGKAPIVIQSSPTADFTFTLDDCESNRVCFDTDVPFGYEIKWDFGNANADNDTSLNNEVCYTYPSAGTYPISLVPNGAFCRFPAVEKMLTLYELGDIVGQQIFNVCIRDSFKTAVLENVPNFDIQWINENGDVVATGRDIVYRVVGSQTLRIIATDPNGCTYTDSVSIVGINEYPQLEYLDQFEVCLGDTVAFPMVNANENHIVSILWEENSHLIGRRDILNPMIGIEPDEMEPFSIAFEATTQFGCILRDTIMFTLGTPNVVSIDHKAKDCENYEVCFSVIGQFTGFAAWDFGDPNKPTGNVIGKEVCFTYSGPGTYVVTLRNIAAFCEFPMVTKTIILRDGLIIFPEDTMKVCAGQEIVLSAPASTAGLSYEWLDLQDNSLGVNRNINLTVNDTTTVRLMVVDDNGCVFEDTLSLSPFSPQYIINMPQVYCQDVQAQVNLVFAGSNAADYDILWSPANVIVSGANTPNPILDVTRNTSAFVTITDKATGCQVKDTVNIVPFTFNIDISASPDTTIDLSQSVVISVINPQNGWRYVWSNGVTTASQTVTPQETTTYSVTVTDANGCTATDQVTIRINPPVCEEDVFIPTAFTPNEDGVNDILYVRSNYIDQMELIIINRWGQEVFTSTSVDNGWDGKFKGKELSPDAFAYYLTATCIDGVRITRRGNISLLR